MNLNPIVIIIAALLILSGCATTATQPTQVKRITPEELAALMPPAVANVSLDEIVADSKQGMTDEAIIAKIQASNSRYELTPSQVLDLSQRGVHAKVLDYIQESNERAKQNAIADELNRREQEKIATEKQLQRARAEARDRFDPFWYPYGIGYYPYGYPFGYNFFYRGRFRHH